MAKTAKHRIHNFLKGVEYTGTTVAPGVTFRVLSKSEDEFRIKTEGIFAKNIESKNSVFDHIANNGVDSAWISMSNCLAIAQYWAMKDKCNIAVIDYSKLQGCEIVDARDGLAKLGVTRSNFAKSSQEICVHYHIPADAIIAVIPYYQVVMMCTAYNPSDRSISCASLDNSLKMLEAFANQPESWAHNFSVMMKRSQKLWAVNRYYGDKLKVGF